MGYLYITRELRCLVLVHFIQWLSSISSRPRSALQRSSADKLAFTSGSRGSTYNVKCSIPVSLEFFEPVRTSGLTTTFSCLTVLRTHETWLLPKYGKDKINHIQTFRKLFFFKTYCLLVIAQLTVINKIMLASQ